MENVKVKNKNYFSVLLNFIKKYWWHILISFGAVFLIGAISSIFTNPTSNWFLNLAKPEFYPPSQVFSVAWTIIYVLLSLGLTSVMVKGQFNEVKVLYIVNFALQILWNVFFFSLMSPFLSVIIMVVLIISAYLLLKKLYGISAFAFYTALPYFAWLIYAFLLNYSIYFLN